MPSDEDLLEQERLNLAYEQANELIAEDPSPENWAAHNEAAVALHDHRSKLAVEEVGPNSGGAGVVALEETPEEG